MTTDTGKTLDKLDELEKEEGSLPLLLQFYRRLLQVQSKAQKRLGTPKIAISSETIQKRIHQGLPLLSFNDLELDWSLVRDVFTKVTAVFARYPELFGEVPAKLKKPGAGRLFTKQAAKAWFSGKELPPKLLEDTENNLMQAMIQAAMQPFLAGKGAIRLGLAEPGLPPAFSTFTVRGNIDNRPDLHHHKLDPGRKRPPAATADYIQIDSFHTLFPIEYTVVNYLHRLGIIRKKLNDFRPPLRIEVITVHSLQVLYFLYIFSELNPLFQFFQIHNEPPLKFIIIFR